jgi:hypothetical protein
LGLLLASSLLIGNRRSQISSNDAGFFSLYLSVLWNGPVVADVNTIAGENKEIVYLVLTGTSFFGFDNPDRDVG